MPRVQIDRAETEARLRAGFEELEKKRMLLKFVSNITDEEMIAYYDPSAPKPLPRVAIPGPCECYICQQQFRSVDQQKQLRMTYTIKLDDDEARELAGESTASINAALGELRGHIAAHGKSISSQWRKKSRDKRAACLLGAMPDLEQGQWIVPRFLKEHEAFDWNRAREIRKRWLLYWLDVESLKKDPARLLGLLYNRARLSPEQWAPHENHNLHFGFHQGFLAIDFSGLCVVMHGEDYGKLVPWEKSAAHRLDIIGFPRGQLILEAQAILLDFLCGVVRQLVEGLTESNAELVIDVASHLQIPKVKFKQSGHVEMWSNYINHPFSEPPRFDVDALISAARAGQQEWGDHVWLMQTDPAYFRQVIRSAVSVMPIERDITVKEQPAYVQALLEITIDSGNYLWWKWTLEDCENIKRLQVKNSDEIKPGKDLPLEYDIVIQSFEMVLIQQMENFETNMQHSFPQRSGFRELFMFRKSGGEVQWRLKHGKRRDSFWDGIYFKTETLSWCIANLVDPPKDRIKYPPSMVFAFMDEYLTTASKDERARIDEILYAQLSFYASLDELLCAIRVHRPGSRTKIPINELIKNSQSRHFQLLRSDEVDETLAKKMGRAGGLIPILEEFLAAYDSHSDGSKKSTDYMEFSKVSPEYMAVAKDLFQARQRPEFNGMLERERRKIININQKPAIQKITMDQSNSTQTEWGTSEKSPIRLVVEKQALKPKSRPKKPVSSITSQVESLLTKPEPAPPIADAFVNAMGEAGFGAYQGSGSAVVFESVNVERDWVGRKIVFHKPHPVAQIDSIRLRAMGKRMERWFGWNKDKFVVH
ncbi:hypothetical protein IFR05_001823 [Cadophora sp. M221]|nr:hypothetical protein IFR05_001823 [Cadophora sp. M221]